MRRHKLERIFGMSSGYATLRTHIKLRGGVTRIALGSSLRIEVLGPRGYDNFTVLNKGEAEGLLAQSESQEYEELRGRPVLAIYNSEKLVGIRMRAIPEY